MPSSYSAGQHGDLRMDPAPGYSDLIPQDLVHLVVEVEFGPGIDKWPASTSGWRTGSDSICVTLGYSDGGWVCLPVGESRASGPAGRSLRAAAPRTRLLDRRLAAVWWRHEWAWQRLATE
jgi:hypothetical protein